MLISPPATPEEIQNKEKLLTDWAEALLAEDSPVAGVERGEAKNQKHKLGWYMRLEGEQKQYFSIWFELGQRTLQYESYFMPAPLDNHEKLYAYLMGKNYLAHGIAFAIGPEAAIYLVGKIPIHEINPEELDRILGTIYAYTESHFRPAMQIGFGDKFR